VSSFTSSELLGRRPVECPPDITPIGLLERARRNTVDNPAILIAMWRAERLVGS
jgi:hypothetical protein